MALAVSRGDPRRQTAVAMTGRPTRRAWLSAGAAVAGAVAAGGTLAGCALPRLTVTRTHLELLFAPYPWTGMAGELLAEGAERFTQTVRGVRLRTQPGVADAGRLATSLLTGGGPDVAWGTDYARLTEAGALLALDERLTAERIDLAQWPAGKVEMLRTPDGVFGLPAYSAAMCYAVRLQDWDDRHLDRPAPTWTHQDFAAAARAMTTDTHAGHRFGACVQWYSTGLGDNAWAFRGFGGAQVGAGGASSTLATPQAVAAGTWLYGLLWGRYACTADLSPQGTPLATGALSMMTCGPWTVAADAATYGAAGFQWDYYPFPRFPQGHATYANTDFFAISARTPNPEAAWALLRWVATDPAWQRWVMHVGLLPPGSAALWDEWEAVVRAAAPPLRDKALNWFADAARGGSAYPQAYYRYRDRSARSIADQYVSKLWNRQITAVQPAFAATDAAINTLLNQAAAEAGASAWTAGSPGRSLPPPPDAGKPPAGTPSLMTVAPDGNVLTGNGAGLDGAADAGAFAASVAVAATGAFTCRITALRDGDGPYVSGGAVAALMARASLEDTAAYIAVGVNAGHGAAVWVRPAQGLPTRSWVGLGAPGTGGVTQYHGQPKDNVLTMPLWLKLERRDATWTGWMSADGRKWTPVGPSLNLPFAGCWIGVFASAHDGSAGFKAGQTVQVTFPECDPQPSLGVQIGSP